MNDVLVPDPREEEVGFYGFYQLFDLMVVCIVDDDLPLFHVRVDTLVVVERDFCFELVILLFGHIQVDVRFLVHLFVRDEVELGDVL